MNMERPQPSPEELAKRRAEIAMEGRRLGETGPTLVEGSGGAAIPLEDLTEEEVAAITETKNEN